MGQKYYVAHGVGPVETGSHYIRGDVKAELTKYYDWRDMGYLWSYVVNERDHVTVIRLCRDMETLPDRNLLLKQSYVKAKVNDVFIENRIPRWVKIFERIHGDTTSQDDDVFRQEALSPGCSSLNTKPCTSRDIIKLAHMGFIAVDGEYSCFVESLEPDSGDIPTYTFDKVARVEDIVDKTISISRVVRTTLTNNPTGLEIAIVMILGRVYLIRRHSDLHPWHLVTKVGRGGSKEPVLSYELEGLLKKLDDNTGPNLVEGIIFGKIVKHPYPWALGAFGTRYLNGYLDCPPR